MLPGGWNGIFLVSDWAVETVPANLQKTIFRPGFAYRLSSDGRLGARERLQRRPFLWQPTSVVRSRASNASASVLETQTDVLNS
jgi:hypothetical protein